MLDHGADPNFGDDFVNINVTARKNSMNPLQGNESYLEIFLIECENLVSYLLFKVLYEREDEFSDRLNSRATFKGFTR